MPHTDAPATPPRTRYARGILPYLLAGVLLIVPLFGLGWYALVVAESAMVRLIHAKNRSDASIARELVERDFDHWMNILHGFSRLPAFSAAATTGDVDAVRDRLHILADAHQRIDRAFVVDPAGTLWADSPPAPESLGRDFSFRDWFQRASQDRVTISPVYRRHAAPQPLVVAIVAPVFAPVQLADRSGEFAGYVVAQVRVDGLTRALQRFGADYGSAFLVDSDGTLAAHTNQDGSVDGFEDALAQSLIGVAAAANGAPFRYRDFVADVDVLASAVKCNVGGNEWLVVAQVPVHAAMAELGQLRMQIAGAGVLLLAVVAYFGFGLARSHNQVRALNGQTAEANERLRDEIRERVRAEEALQHVNADLERHVEERTVELRRKDDLLNRAQKMEAIGRLSGGIAHDFNNLLSVVIGYAELVHAETPASSPARRRIKQILEAGEQAASLTRQLLAFSRNQVLEPQIVHLNGTIARTVKLLERVIGEDIQLVTRYDKKLVPVKVDPSQVEQIVMNLAINARDAMPNGGRLTIETANVELDETYTNERPGTQPGMHAMLSVSDTGGGMDRETVDLIFEPFFTTKELGRGTGLGLATVYGIVKQSGGNIWVYSEPGRGSTFKVYLPATKEASDSRSSRRLEAVSFRGRGTILVVEDEPALRELIHEILKAGGYTVLLASSAEDALEQLEQAGSIDLLLTDVVLPNKSGPALAAEVKERRPELKVLFMSGYTNDVVVHNGNLAATSAFYQKPVRRNALLAKVYEVLNFDMSDDETPLA